MNATKITKGVSNYEIKFRQEVQEMILLAQTLESFVQRQEVDAEQCNRLAVRLLHLDVLHVFMNIMIHARSADV